MKYGWAGRGDTRLIVMIRLKCLKAVRKRYGPLKTSQIKRHTVFQKYVTLRQVYIFIVAARILFFISNHKLWSVSELSVVFVH